MDATLTVIASAILIIGIVLYSIGLKRKKHLEDNYTTQGILIKYKRVGRYLYPVIEFKEKGVKKIITKGGIVNYKPIKIGSEIKILKLDNGNYLTDCDMKIIQYYAIALMLVFLLVIYISFNV